MKNLRISVVVFQLVLLFFLSPVFSQETIVIQPGASEGKDAMVRSLFPYQNWGTDESLFAAAWTYDDDFGITRPLFDFDLSVIPDSSEILQASLSLYYDPECGHEGHSGENEAYLLRVTGFWEESAVDWNNQPTTSTENQVLLPASSYYNQDYLDIDVTDLVKDMISEPDNSYGFLIRHVVEVQYRSLIFASSDHPNENLHPKLEITYQCPMPNAQYEYDVNGNFVQFSDYSVNANSWFWDFGDGFFSDLKNPEHYFEENGSYEVCLTVTNDCGSSIICDSVNVYISSISTDLAEKSVKIYPNPGNGHMYISFAENSGEKVSIEVVGCLGTSLFRKQIEIFNVNQKVELDLSKYDPGIYYIKLANESLNETHKIFIQ
ncbi:MAG: DNRLRE domain-containing protein [Chlorobi bacterium]|nr:DNRLRE domain-containing protein [Chlorobiota bacterium]